MAPSCQNLAQGANCQVTVGFTPPPGLTSAPTTTLVLTPQGGSGPISIPLTINPLPTTTFASSVAITYSTSSQIVSLNATVTSPAGTVDEGTVTFTVNGTSITSGPLSNGGASVTYTAPAGLGTSEVKAVYNPGPLFTTSSGTATLTVSPASTTTTALDSTATCAFSCINPTAPLTATVTSPAGTVSVGSVTFTVTDPNSGATIGTATGAVSNGQATANLTFSCGNSITFTIQAVYDPSPSGNFTGSRSGPATLDAANVCG